MSSITERVAAGAAYLDEHDPDWWKPDVERAINLGTLNLSDTGCCILGQRCPLETWTAAPAWAGEYEAFGIRLSGLAVSDIRDLDPWAVPLGFQRMRAEDLDDELLDYERLTAEWKRVITERRAA